MNETVKAATDTANKIMASLSSTPTLLVLVLLNTLMIGAATWFLTEQNEQRAQALDRVISIIEKCLSLPKTRGTEI